MEEGVGAADAMFLGSRTVVGMEALSLVLILGSCSSNEMASERADRRMGSTGVVAGYPKEPVQVVRSATPSIVHPTKDRLGGVQA